MSESLLIENTSTMELAREFRELRRLKGHFDGASWNPALDTWMGRKHRIMIELRPRFIRENYTVAEDQAATNVMQPFMELLLHQNRKPRLFRITCTPSSLTSEALTMKMPHPWMPQVSISISIATDALFFGHGEILLILVPTAPNSKAWAENLPILTTTHRNKPMVFIPPTGLPTDLVMES